MRAISGGEIACFIGSLFCCLGDVFYRMLFTFFEHIGSTDEPGCQTIVAGCVGLI